MTFRDCDHLVIKTRWSDRKNREISQDCISSVAIGYTILETLNEANNIYFWVGPEIIHPNSG